MAQTSQVHEAWDGSFETGNDIALIRLDAAAPVEIQTYGIYRNSDEVGQVADKAGYGRTGTGDTGDDIVSGTKHAGQNLYDALGDVFDTVGGIDPIPGSQLAYDFDNGLVANDAFDFFDSSLSGGNLADLGVGANEVMSAPGDSGGPSFINGLIAGVTSWGLTLERRGGPPPRTSDVDKQLNSSFGEFGFDTRVSFHADWVDSHVMQLLLTVDWAVDADGAWDLASNWTSDPQLPQPESDVTIDVGGATVRTITHSTGSTTINSLTNSETLIVSGGSSLTTTLGLTTTGTVEVNDATSALNVGDALTVNSGGQVNVNSGNTVTVDGTTTVNLSGTININNGTLAANDDVLIDGGTLTQQSTGQLTLAATRTLTIQNSGLADVTGDYSVASTRTIAITTSGTFNATGNVTVDGTLTRDAASTFTFGSANTLTVQNIGLADFSGDYTLGSGQTIVINSGGTFNATGNVTVDGTLARDAASSFNLGSGNTLTIQNSGLADFTGDYAVDTGRAVDVIADGTLNVTGSVAIGRRGES